MLLTCPYFAFMLPLHCPNYALNLPLKKISNSFIKNSVKKANISPYRESFGIFDNIKYDCADTIKYCTIEKK